MDITCANPRAKWRKAETDAQIFKTENDDPRPKYYVLEMFPYPPGRIHMGYVRNYPWAMRRALSARARRVPVQSRHLNGSWRVSGISSIEGCFGDWLIQLFNDRRTLSCNSDGDISTWKSCRFQVRHKKPRE
jgi:hypothetical protein